MIEIRNVTKKYGETSILNHVDYVFPQKGITCLRGASGEGKTTLLNLLAGFDRDYEGEILAGDTSISKMDDGGLCKYRRDNIGFVFQNYHLITGYTVLENIVLTSELPKEQREESLKKAKSLLKRLGMEEKEHQKIENLSGGQKQRVAIARALMGDPQMILADEPTGSLDRTTSNEIMELLWEIARERLVVVITHDDKICEYADEIIKLKEQKIIVEKSASLEGEGSKALEKRPVVQTSAFARGCKNFRVHMLRYIGISIGISCGVLAFLFSLSFTNVMEGFVEDFKEKNTAFNNGYIKGADDGTILKYLQEDERLEQVYYQYKLNHIQLELSGKAEAVPEKYPTAKATQELSYGVMPRPGKNEIAISPSLAKKFNENIKNLLGENVKLTMEGKEYFLSVSGIYNAGYDDFILSLDVEQQLYQGMEEKENYSISYDVSVFEDIVSVSNSLELRGLTSENASKEVYALEQTFHSLNTLFLVISILILGVGMFICAVLLIKLQRSRYREIGLLSALGYNRKHISSMISVENLLLSVFATVINLALLGVGIWISGLFQLPFAITGMQILVSVVVTFAFVILLSGGASYRLVRTEPAAALCG